MVHLGRIATDKDLAEHDKLMPKMADLNVGGSDSFTASVYGSKFAAEDIPRHEMPETEMPREVAYRMIK